MPCYLKLKQRAIGRDRIWDDTNECIAPNSIQYAFGSDVGNLIDLARNTSNWRQSQALSNRLDIAVLFQTGLDVRLFCWSYFHGCCVRLG